MEFDLENPLPYENDIHSSASLFKIESDHMTPITYLQALKATDLEISVRHETVSLILDFCLNFDPFLSYLSINYLDRFLSTQTIMQQGKPWISRLLAVSCVSLALKMTKTEFSLAALQQDGGFIFDTQTIQRMEMLILGALKWRMRSITPFSFINFFVCLFKFKDQPLRQSLKARAAEIIFKSRNEVKLLEFKPSINAASALLYACHELFPLQFPCFREAILDCSYVNKEKLFGCYDGMQGIAMDGYESVLEVATSNSTQVSVLGWQCRCSTTSSDSLETENQPEPNEEPAIANADVTGPNINRIENDVKRRKISSCGFRSNGTLQLSQIQQC